MGYFNSGTMTYNPYKFVPATAMAMYQGAKQFRGRATRSAWRNPGSMVMTKTKRKSKYAKSSFKDKVFDSMSARHYTSSQGRSMTHNTLYTLCPTAGVVTGDTNTTRDGDAIILCALKLKGFYNTDAAAGAYSFRILVGYSGEEFPNTTLASGLGISEIFLPGTAAVNTPNGEVNPKAFTVLHDEKITVNSEISAVISRSDYALTVPLNNKRFSYQEAGSPLGKTNNLYVVVVADVVNGVAGTTNVGGTSVSWDLIYKNAN